MDTDSRIEAFLYFGYLPEFQDTHISCVFPDIDSPRQIFENLVNTDDESVVIKTGIAALKHSFSKLFRETDGKDHIVPLSGGLDSRGVLAGLINAGVKDRLTTVTFGIPGSWDYEIGNSIARKIGTPHRSIDLRDFQVTTERLLETARNGSAWTFLIDAYYNSLIPSEFGSAAVYWSGYMGDALAGGNEIRLPDEENWSWQDGKSYFVNNKFLNERRKMIMSSPGFDPLEYLPSTPFVDHKMMAYYDQYCIFVLNNSYFKRVVTFKGYNYQLPYCSRDWVEFILQLPRCYSLNKRIYKKILINLSPELFSLPVANYRGAKINDLPLRKFTRRAFHRLRTNIGPANSLWNRLGIYRMLQYLDFDDALRNREDYRLMVSENIHDLQGRKIINWLDIESIWKDHQNKSANYGVSLMLLTALEISLKVDDEIFLSG